MFVANAVYTSFIFYLVWKWTENIEEKIRTANEENKIKIAKLSLSGNSAYRIITTEPWTKKDKKTILEAIKTLHDTIKRNGSAELTVIADKVTVL
jgi:translation initiation factor 2 alpha subunit (eIF-2alpha)